MTKSSLHSSLKEVISSLTCHRDAFKSSLPAARNWSSGPLHLEETKSLLVTRRFIIGPTTAANWIRLPSRAPPFPINMQSDFSQGESIQVRRKPSGRREDFKVLLPHICCGSQPKKHLSCTCTRAGTPPLKRRGTKRAEMRHRDDGSRRSAAATGYRHACSPLVFQPGKPWSAALNLSRAEPLRSGPGRMERVVRLLLQALTSRVEDKHIF
ncbi:uncharacterized protein LOC144209861 [Stigmatopora nigra]